jgi:DNA-binding NarL/FixJ family response regulator
MPPGSPIVVADGTPMLRAGVAGTLRAAGYDVAGETALGAEVAELVGRHAADVVVIGGLPDVPLTEVVRRLRAAPAPVRVVLLVGRIGPDAIAELLSLDVEGLVPRTIDGDALLAVVERVRSGQRVVDPGVLVADDAVVETADAATTLTGREREVLVLLAAGHSNREIASSLYVSLPTVKTHLAHIYAKLGAKNRNEALGRAVAAGLL